MKRVSGQKKSLRGVIIIFASFILLINLVFWALVAARFSPVQQRYELGRVVWVGQHALVFGHGYWMRSNGFWQHQTLTQLQDGTIYRGPTLNLLTKLRIRGARTVWGTWCYSGDYPYIQKDLVTGKETPWPSYASYNKKPGLTIPIWIGTTFVRLWWPQRQYQEAPEVISYVSPDTVHLGLPSLERMVHAYYLVQRQFEDLPQPDSITWRTVRSREAHTISIDDYYSLSINQRRELRELKTRPFTPDERIGLIRYWVRGRAFPVHVRIPSGISSPWNFPALAHESVQETHRYVAYKAAPPHGGEGV